MTRRLLGVFLLGLMALTAALSEGQAAPSINATWATTGGMGGALNVNITSLPPNAAVEVEVKDVSHGSQTEDPVGKPPGKADEKGNWPGTQGGSHTGYPDTAKDPGGTKYVVSVKVNGKTGPSKEVIKPGKERRSFWSILGTLGTIYLTDALGVTSPVVELRPVAAWFPVAA